MVYRHRLDIESISARCRSDIVDDICPTSSPRANMESARHCVYVGQMSAWYHFRHLADIWPTSGRHLADIWPTSGRHRASYVQTSSLYRPDVGLISLTTSGRHRAHVQTWSRPDISRHLPISGRYNFRYQADVVADISRYQADIRPIALCYLGLCKKKNCKISSMNDLQKNGKVKSPFLL